MKQTEICQPQLIWNNNDDNETNITTHENGFQTENKKKNSSKKNIVTERKETKGKGKTNELYFFYCSKLMRKSEKKFAKASYLQKYKWTVTHSSHFNVENCN